MITNQRQYRIAKAQARQAEQEGASGAPLAALRRGLAEYEALASGGQAPFLARSLDKLPDALIRARIALGLSQKALAVRLGVKEQQVQRYEATGYGSASLSRVQAVAQALGVTVTAEVSLPALSQEPGM